MWNSVRALNILTGETGAGKSIIIGSVSMALGGKASRRTASARARPTPMWSLYSPWHAAEKSKALADLDVVPDENGLIIISRKIMPSQQHQPDQRRDSDHGQAAARLPAC